MTVIVLTLMVGLSFQGCKNYDDGPFTLVPPKKRLVGKWEFSNSSTNTPAQFEIASYEIEFEDDNDFRATTTIIVNDTTITRSPTGEWEFEDNKETVELTPDNLSAGASIQELEIEKLTKDELIVETNSGSEIEFDKK